MSSPIFWIQANRTADDFPPPEQALVEPDGLLAAGGDLTPARLLQAYRSGIFPWYADGQPILWWAPDPRSILCPASLKISRSLRRTVKRGQFAITLDREFDQVMRGCAAPRDEHGGTWITDAMKSAYATLHEHGYAHSVECWSNNELVGGLYGVAIGRVFFGESMFSRVTDASKVAMVKLCEHLSGWDYELIDCQVHNPHLASLGAETIPRSDFNARLINLCVMPPAAQAWQTTEPL